MTAIMKPIVAATDGRTKDGRIAREMYLTFRQLKERLEFLRVLRSHATEGVAEPGTLIPPPAATGEEPTAAIEGTNG